MPLLGQQPEVSDLLGSYASTLSQPPVAILGRPLIYILVLLYLIDVSVIYLFILLLVVTAHWIEDTISVTSSNSHSLLFDYGGFPAETYKYKCKLVIIIIGGGVWCP